MFANRLIRRGWLSGLLGAFVVTAMGGPGAEAGWFEKATGVRTPEAIRKIAPNGIQLPKVPRHNPTSQVAPNSVFNQTRIPVQPANNSSNKRVTSGGYNPNYWIERQRAEQERLRLQQQQIQLQQQQLQFQRDAAKAEQKAQIIGTIFQGIDSLIPQNQPQPSVLPYDPNGYQPVYPMNQYQPQDFGGQAQNQSGFNFP